MSTFRTLNPKAPARALTILAGAVIFSGGLLAVLLVTAARDRQVQTIEMQNIVTLAAQASTDQSPAGDLTTIFYVDDTPQLAQAALQSDLQALADRHRAEIEVMRAEDVTRIDGLVRLTLSLNGTVPEGELGPLLASLDAAEPVIIVDDMTLRRTQAARGATGRHVAFQFELYGLSQ